MPIRCTLRPNRSKPRYWTAIRAGQACCYAIAHGATRAQIITEMEKCSGRDQRPADDEAAAAMEIAAQALESSNGILDADAALLQRFMFVTNLPALVWRLIARLGRAGAAIAVGVTALREVSSGRLKQLAVQKAANSEAIAIVRRAAANAARFRQTGT